MSFLKLGGQERVVENESTAKLWAGDEYQPSSALRPIGSNLQVLSSQRPPCGNPECAGGWTVPWRSRRRPIFEGRWGCSGRCVLSMVRAVVRREFGDGLMAMEASHRHRVPLGLVMLAQGWITQPQLRKALDAQRENMTGRIGDWLVSECSVDRERVTRGLSVQWNCPVLTTEGFHPEAMALVMPRVFIEKFGLLPLRVAGSRILYLGFEERLDASATLVLEQMTELHPESGLVNGAQFQTARGRLLECDSVETKLEAVADTDALSARIAALLEQKQPAGSRLVRLHEYYWLRMWLESSAIGKAGSLPATTDDMFDHVFTVGTRA